MPDFEVFNRSLLALKREPCVTILRRGVMSLNRSAHLAIGSPAAVELLYDPEARIVGLQPIDRRADGAQDVRAAGNGARGPFLVSAMAFARFYDIDISVSRRWVAFLDDGILCVNLDEPAVDVAKGRGDGQRPLPATDIDGERQFGKT